MVREPTSVVYMSSSTAWDSFSSVMSWSYDSSVKKLPAPLKDILQAPVCLKHVFVVGTFAGRQFCSYVTATVFPLGFYLFFNPEGVPDDDSFGCTDRCVFLKEVSKLLAVQCVVPMKQKWLL